MNSGIKSLLYLTGIGLIAYGAYNYYVVEKDLFVNSQFDVTKISIVEISPSSVTLNLTVRLTNNSHIDISIQDMYLDIYLNGVNVGFVLQPIYTNIKSKASSDIPLTASLNLPNIVTGSLSNIVDMIKQGSVTIKTIGYASVKSGFISVTMPIEQEQVVPLPI